ncbi:uncharacterized protein B0P05DRAFT_596799 [Gilbertella persicaria]|uniref:uncharacterized protein n=1 Tax=Gilbertella persicaria TaxID=101096 RepID=UPI002220D21B|nr:uncharacterized protein B0P05DRAFT_596799 [Gilbertella persicaria]KAI8078948.1 hypothetical protein B0P05DRAFT_596799 [Gilbertella persicaria]
MNIEVADKLGQLIKQITETGEWTLNPEKLKTIKSFCKRSDVNVQIAFDWVMFQLKKKHAQIRYSALQLIEQLFDRSKYFRDALTEDFPVFTQLVIGIQGRKLPPPAQVATKLKDYGIALIKSWYIRYGEKHRQLSIAYDFLLDNGFLDREGGSLSSIHANDYNKSNIEARRKAIHASRFELLKSDIDNHIELIRDNLTNMEGCFEILIPKNVFENDDLDFDALLRGEAANTTESGAGDTYKQNIISHGLGSNRYKITIDMSEETLMDDVKETEDNKIVFDQLREAYTLLETKQLSHLNTWINALIKIELADRVGKEKLVKELLKLKEAANEAIRKCKLLGIEVYQPKPNSTSKLQIIEDNDDDEYMDELFEEVDIDTENKESAKDTLSSSKLPPTQRIFPLSFEPSMMEDATYSGPPPILPVESSINKEDKGKTKLNTGKEELLKRAPVVEWGDDLYYWDKNHVQFNTSGIERDHRFMGIGEGTNEMPEHLLAELRKRPVYYKSEVTKPLQACKHPLRNGGLCPRKDLVTCPFHGKIIPRDDFGVPLNKDVPSSSTSLNNHHDQDEVYGVSSKPPDQQIMNNLWELLETDIINQSGTKNGKRRGKQIEKKKSALIDIRKKPSTPLTRLNSKISSSKSRKMAQEAIEYEREMKSRNKSEKF